MRSVALLRGINLGARRRVAMADLRALLGDLGYEDVETYLQSGNVLFSPDQRQPDEVAREIRAAVAEQLGVDSPVLVRAGAELAAVVSANPWPELTGEPTLLAVAFLDGAPDPGWAAALDAEALAPERLAIGERALYAFYANGVQGSRLPLDDRKVGTTTTVRNWRTTTEIARRAAP